MARYAWRIAMHGAHRAATLTLAPIGPLAAAHIATVTLGTGVRFGSPPANNNKTYSFDFADASSPASFQVDDFAKVGGPAWQAGDPPMAPGPAGWHGTGRTPGHPGVACRWH